MREHWLVGYDADRDAHEVIWQDACPTIRGTLRAHPDRAAILARYDYLEIQRQYDDRDDGDYDVIDWSSAFTVGDTGYPEHIRHHLADDE